MLKYTGLVTHRLEESKRFYTECLGFETVYQGEWYLLLRKDSYELGFLKPSSPEQHRFFQPAFKGGSWLALEVDDVDALYACLDQTDAVVLTQPTTELWGERHFMVEDPNGMGIDIFSRVPVGQM